MSFTIIFAEPAHLAALPAIERAAAALFPAADLSDAMRDAVCDPVMLAEAQAAGRLFVALVGDEVVGFALTVACDDALHLEELDVHPDYGRRGIGRALVDRVLTHARDAGFQSVTLNTFRHLAWNAPFYARLGFRILTANELQPHLRRRIVLEQEEGFDMRKRVAMQCDLGLHGDPEDV